MTPKQRSFAEHYAVDHNGAAAAVRAGYAKRSARQIASELLSNPDVQGLVAKYEAHAAKRLGVTKERILVELQAAIACARLQNNPMAMIKGWTEIAKISGFYSSERTKIEISVGGASFQAKITAMSDAELLALLDEPELESEY